jgi:hypothetical protein
MLDTDEVLNAARAAKAAGSTRFCMGAAWRDLAGRKSNFKKIVGFVKEIRYASRNRCMTTMVTPFYDMSISYSSSLCQQGDGYGGLLHIGHVE